MVSQTHPHFSIARQCVLLKVARSILYYKPKPVSDDDLTLMRRIDEIYMKWPFYGSRKMVEEFRDERCDVHRKRVRRLMRLMGLEAIYQKPNTSRKHPAHKIYPYPLRNLDIDHANHVWCADITCIPMARGFVYLVAVMDWFSRRVLTCRLSITLEGDCCVEALQEAMDRYGKPKLFNTDQGSQFTSGDFSGRLLKNDIAIILDGKGHFLDNIFIERLWRSLQYENVFIKAYGSVAEARLGINAWMKFYNDVRKHQALGYWTPREIFVVSIAYGYVHNASALNTYPQAPPSQTEKDSIHPCR
jgi:putative transposase